jgi:hypothetical protein
MCIGKQRMWQQCSEQRMWQYQHFHIQRELLGSLHQP